MEIKLKKEDWIQIRAYVIDRDEGNKGGWYYGIKEVFERRHKKILDFLEEKIGDEK